jgi:hypothetical protein
MSIYADGSQGSGYLIAPLKNEISPSNRLHTATLRRAVLIASLAGALFSTAGLASGISSDPGDDDSANTVEAGPATGAVRLSSVEGQVRVVQDGQVIADPATANLPLFEGSQVMTGDDGRAEVQLEDGSIARLSPNTTLTFSVLRKEGGGTKTEVVLNQGLAYFEMQPANSEHGLRVNYGSSSFAATSFSVVRIRMDVPPGDLAVFSGNVHLDRGDSLQLDIHGGESLGLDTGDLSKYSLNETIDKDSWDSWNADRDQVLNQMSAEKTPASSGVNMADNVGMNDLDANGSWYNVPGQGYIWSPYEAQAQGVSWDPYGYGSWVLYPRYGYVWNSGYDWGYAPYQCGLWNYYDTIGWGWLPGDGCNPWWQNGGWGYGLGRYPSGYRPPRRPLRPVGPQPGRPRPAVAGRPLVARQFEPGSVIPVDRRMGGGGVVAVTTHPRQPVTINGHTVEPISPIAPRPVYERPGGGGVRAGNGFIGGGSNGGSSGFYAGSHPVTSGSHPVYSPVYPGGSSNRPSAGSHPSGGSFSGGGSRPSGGGSSGGGHVASSGGGGGGGGHASSGGGGGGGGASHK